MKIKTIAIAVLAVLTLTACPEKPDDPVVDPGKGLLNFSVSVPGSGLTYSATTQGPYKPDETIIIEIPSSSENPVDVTSLECYASLDNNCHTDPAVPPTADFTNPYKITVVLADGSTQTNYIKVDLIYPEIKIDFVWQTMAMEMNQVVYNDMYVAADDDYVYVLDAAGYDTDCIHVLEKANGHYVKDIALPTTFIAQIFVDDAGVLCCSRYNIYGAGFRFFIYDKTSSSWSDMVIDYASYEGHEIADIPLYLGIRASLVGNVTNGTAYVIATAINSKSYYVWKFTDGVPQETPTITNYGPAAEDWYFANVRMKSAEPGSDLYVAGINYVAYPNEEQSYTYFHKLKSTGDVVSMKNDDMNNLGWRILNFKTFELGGMEMLAEVSQYGPHRYDGCQFKVFNITDESKWTLQPGDPGYDIDFCNFYSGIYPTTNYNMGSGVEVSMNGENEAYIILGKPSREAGPSPAPTDIENCAVMCFKATYTKRH